MPEGGDLRRPAAPNRHATERGDGVLTLPNLITLARLCAVPATIWLILHERFALACAAFVAAGLSDALDGWIARAFHARSALGALLDPVADKALLVSVYVTLAAVGRLPDWLAILVVFRDLLIVGGLLALWGIGVRPAIRPLALSRVNTVLQVALAGLALLAAAGGLGVGWTPALAALTWAVAATTAVTGGAYVLAGLRAARGAGVP